MWEMFIICCNFLKKFNISIMTTKKFCDCGTPNKRFLVTKIFCYNIGLYKPVWFYQLLVIFELGISLHALLFFFVYFHFVALITKEHPDWLLRLPCRQGDRTCPLITGAGPPQECEECQEGTPAPHNPACCQVNTWAPHRVVFLPTTWPPDPLPRGVGRFTLTCAIATHPPLSLLLDSQRYRKCFAGHLTLHRRGFL
jgi:hypothetical protein